MAHHYSIQQKNELREKYKQEFGELEDLVNNWDPIGLISGGAPKDEYDCLTAKLLISLKQNKSQEEMKEEILAEMDDHFSWPMGETEVLEFLKRLEKWKESMS